MNNYLYEKLLIKPYPEHQYMDKESIDWLEHHLDITVSLDDVKTTFKNFKKFPINKLDVNKTVYEKYNCFGIHGIRHQLRVSLYIWIIIQYYNIELENDDIIQLLQATLYHDLLRKNDNTDIDHGKRSATWIKKNYEHIKDSIINAILNHNIQIDNNNIYDILIKTADSLDRYRLPKEKWWLKKEYLLMDIDDKLIDICKFITLLIEKNTCNMIEVDKIVGEFYLCLKKIEII